MVTIDELLSEILQFRDARSWRQFHTPRHLAAALSIETSEIEELMLWKTDAEVLDLLRSLKGKRRVEEEIADVLIYAFLLSHEVGVDPAQAVLRKLEQNAKRYPVSLSKGRAVKYSELPVKKKEEADAIQELLFPGNPPH
jgi:NTP pyrophosphatase (non-canonical NTP hydrolase)